MKIRNRIMARFLFLTAMSLIGSIQAAVIAPQTGGGAAIDPSGNSDVDFEASGSALLSTFNGLSDRVTQVNWSGISGTTGNTIDGNDLDVRIDHGNNAFAATVSDLQNYNTGSGGNGYQWYGTNGQQLTISFGTHDGSFENDRTVEAAGLVFTNIGGAYTDITVKYLDNSDTVLSTQSFSGAPDDQGSAFGGSDVFSGYVSDSQNISYMTIDITRNTGSSLIGLDALTYAGAEVQVSAIPEPSGVLALGCLFGASMLNRRRS